MPTNSPFPLDIVPKVNSPELEAWFLQFGFQFYLSAEEIGLMIQGMQYLYENIDPTSNDNLLQLGETPTTAYPGDRGKDAYDFAVSHGNVDNTSDVNKPVSTAQAAADALVASNANSYSNNLITNLKDGVSTAGNTLQKLYNLILGATSEVYVANITERNAYNIPKLPFSIFVTDDGDGKWAKYQATTTGVNATYVKTSDPDLLNAVMSAVAIKTAYESNADTNAFTNAFLSKLTAIANNATANSSDIYLLNRSNHIGSQLASTISDFTTAVTALALLKSNNLSDLANKSTARVNLEIDKKTIVGNISYTILSSDKVISTSVALTASRTWALPTGLAAGKEILVTDEAGVVGTFNIIISVPTGKKLNGVVNGTETIRAAYGWRRLLADGDDNFTFDAGVQRIIQNKTIGASAYTILDSDSNFFLIFTATCTVTVPSGLTNLQFQGMQSTFNAPVTFVAGSGVTLQKAASENLVTAEQFSAFGIRYLSGTSPQIYNVFGRLQQI